MRNKQTGFSLVELMVAMFMGLILLGAIGQLFLSNKQAYRFGDNLSRLQENSRYAMTLLGRELRFAGYANISVVPTDSKVSFTGTVITGVEGGSAPDEFTIGYEGATNCMGTAATGVVTDRFTLSGGQLLCTSTISTGTTSAVMLDGVENMQILYGVDSSNDQAADRYVAANAVTDWSKVVDLQVCLRFVSTDGNLTSQPQDANQLICPGEATGGIGVADRRFRRTVTNIFNLRNRVNAYVL